MWNKKIIWVAVMAIGLAGCSNGLSKAEEAEYQRMLGIKESLNTEYEEAEYARVIEYLIGDEVVITEELEESLSEYAEYLTEDMVSTLRNRAEEAIKSGDTIDSGDTIEGEDLWEEFEGDPMEAEWEAYEEDGMYPIFDRYYSVVNYGTKEEMIASIEDFNNLPVNEIKNTTMYPNMLVFRVINKYQGEIAVVAKLKGGKVDAYEIFR